MTDTDISPESVEHLCAIHEGYEQHGTAATIRALSAALTQSRAETAAAFEVAGEVSAVFVHERLYKAKFPACSYHHADIKAAVKALTPADAQAALQAMIDAAVKEARKSDAELIGALHGAADIGRYYVGLIASNLTTGRADTAQASLEQIDEIIALIGENGNG